MKTLTVTLPDHIANAVEAQASRLGQSAAELAARTLRDAFGETDWFDDLDEADKAAVREGIADVAQGAVREHAAVFESLRQKHGW